MARTQRDLRRPASRAVAETAGRALAVLVTAVMAAALLGACEPHTVAIDFDPEVGDTFGFESHIDATVTRTLEGETERLRDASRLRAEETVTGTRGEEITVDVTVTRDGAAPRTFEVRLDRASRLAGIELVEGVPVEALGIDLGADLPPGITGPPAGDLEPGLRWSVDEAVSAPGIPEPLRVRGTGRISRLGVEEGHDVAEAHVVLEVPVRAVVDSSDGTVTLSGAQVTSSTAAYDLDDGAVRREHVVISGTTQVIVEPPVGVQAEPLRGSITYRIVTDTRRAGS